MNKTIKALALVASFVLMGYAPVKAQTAAATPAAPVVKIDGLVDAYYTYNFTNSANKQPGNGNNGYAFNETDNSYSLGLAETKITATQGNAMGFIDLAFGQEYNLAIGQPYYYNNAGIGFDVLQAYASYTAGQFTFTGGRFATWMGFEVIDSASNWNYGRGLLFWYTIPLWHQGVSVAFSPDSTFKVTGYATNGWNNVYNNDKYTGQTYGLQLAYTPNSTWNFYVNALDGPGRNTPYNVQAQDFWVGEAIIAFNPTSDWSFALDAEYGAQDKGSDYTTWDGKTANSADFWGAALYAKYQISSDWFVAARVEELKDEQNLLDVYGNGFGFGTFEAREATLTVTHAFTPAWNVSLEGRYDYELGDGTAPTAGNGDFTAGSPDQLTATLSTAFVF
jgi:hypothetical protein